MASIGTKAARGAVWNASGSGLNQILRFGASIVIARCLTPEEVAVGGLAIVGIGMFQVFAARGFAQSLVQQEEIPQALLDSVFWFTLALAVTLGGIAWACSGWVADYYQEPAVAQLFPWLAAGLVFGTLASVPMAVVHREMRFLQANIVLLVSGTFTSLLGMLLAVGGYGYFAMVVPGVVGLGISALGSFAVSRYLPRWNLSWQEFCKVRLFGFSQLGSSVVRYLNDNGDYLVMSMFWPKAAFGQYYFAFERSRQPFNLLYGRLGSVLFPSFSRIRRERPADLRTAFLRSTKLMCMVMYPLHILLIAYAGLIIPAIFGEQWRPSVPIFQVFAAATFLRSIGAGVPSMILALNRAQVDLAYNLFRLVITLPALLAIGIMGGSPTQVAILLLILWAVQIPVYLGYMLRSIELPAIQVWHQLRRIVFASLGAAAVAFIMARFELLSFVDSPFDAILQMIITLMVLTLIAFPDIRESALYVFQKVLPKRTEALT